VQIAPSPDRARLAAIRTTPDAEAAATALYFMDLSRGVETLIFPNRRIGSVDYSSDGSFILYSAMPAQTSQEDLFFSQPNGQNEQNLTSSVDFRERHARIDPFSSTAVYEGIDESGVSRVYLFAQTPLTSGPASGEPLPDTPYVVGGDADPVFSPDGQSIAFRRLTGVGNGGLGTWDLLTLRLGGSSTPTAIATGALFRGAPDWGSRGILYIETDAATSESRLVLLQPDGTGHTVLRTEDAGFRMGSPRWLAGS
jgi:Tol biopolymer transport system component